MEQRGDGARRGRNAAATWRTLSGSWSRLTWRFYVIFESGGVGAREKSNMTITLRIHSEMRFHIWTGHLPMKSLREVTALYYSP